jgi:hypothetical protein
MFFPGIDNFDVGKTDTASIVAYQEFVQAVGGNVYRDGLAVEAQVFKTRPVQRPQAISPTQGGSPAVRL